MLKALATPNRSLVRICNETGKVPFPPPIVIPDFLPTSVHDRLVEYFDSVALIPKGRRRIRKYEEGHWDAVIKNYREVQIPLEDQSRRPDLHGLLVDAVHAVQETVDRLVPEQMDVTLNAVPGGRKWMKHAHLIDLCADGGEIRSHVDAVKFSGDIIAGISFVTDGEMRLEYDDCSAALPSTVDTSGYIRLTLPARSLYILHGPSRYCYGHSVPAPGARRFSLIVRNEKMETL